MFSCHLMTNQYVYLYIMSFNFGLTSTTTSGQCMLTKVIIKVIATSHQYFSSLIQEDQISTK